MMYFAITTTRDSWHYRGGYKCHPIGRVGQCENTLYSCWFNQNYTKVKQFNHKEKKAKFI